MCEIRSTYVKRETRTNTVMEVAVGCDGLDVLGERAGDGGSKLLYSVGQHLPGYTARYSRRQPLRTHRHEDLKSHK